MAATLAPSPLAEPIPSARKPTAPLDPTAWNRTEVLDEEPTETYSRRACRKDGSAMELENRDAPGRRWTCPACGSRRR